MKNKLEYLFLTIILVFSSYRPLLAGDPKAAPSPVIRYTVAMPQPQTHYVEVDMQLSGFAQAVNLQKTGYIDLKMPVWTPGSYLIREYARHVEGFTAQSNNQPVRAEKIRKNAWRIYTTTDQITVRYRVYAFELSVRTSFVDESHGYLNGASLFLFNDALKALPAQLTVVPFSGWKKVSVALPLVRTANGAFTYDVANFDLLVDSPVETGNHATFSFTAAGVPHTVAQYGEVVYDERRLAADYRKICETATGIFGEHPCKDYTFIVHHTTLGGGGLEHQNSTTLQTNRVAYATETNYKGFLTLVAHEYFHLWNVKRLRPVALGPFDYENENYTRSLWEAEGFTSFYEDYILRRAGFHTPEHYLNVIAADINGIENLPGNREQSVAESSYDAWIKYYRPNENSNNSTVSYYNKGSVLASLLNLSILSSTNGERNLDDVMRFMYNEYYKKQKRGFTDEELKQALEQIGGRKLDDFFSKYVYGTETIDYNAFFAPVGLQLVNNAAPVQDGFLGVSPGTAGGRLTIAGVRRDSPAWQQGLNVGDELLAIDSVRLAGTVDDFNKQLAGRPKGQTIRVLVNRNGFVQEFPVILGQNPLVAYRLEPVNAPTDRQRMLFRKWLYLN